MIVTSLDIARICGGVLSGPPDINIREMLIDSRKVTGITPASLFIALRGGRNDGHDYIEDLYTKGVRAYMICNSFESDGLLTSYPGAAFISCTDTLEAMQKLAAWKRSMFKGMVVAITGSNGKTIVKEWFSDILGRGSNVLRSPRSYNSQTGVPLSVWPLDDTYDFGVFEAGMSRPGEIARLENILRPEIGVITNIGDAHQENFKDMDTKIREKLLLFRGCRTIVYSPDDHKIDRLIRQSPSLRGKELFTWGSRDRQYSVSFEKKEGSDKSGQYSVVWNKGSMEINMQYSDKASVLNTMNVITLLIKTGMDPALIKKHIEDIKPVEMRMEQKEGINGCTLVEDFYNSDPGALSIALDYLKDIPGRRRSVIISDFVEQNNSGKDIYSEVAALTKAAAVDRLICVGEQLLRHRDYFEDGTLFFRDTNELVGWFSPEKFRNEAVLIKGARKYRFERLMPLLELKAHITTLEINMSNLRWNLNRYRSFIGRDTRVMAMVKAFAYGTGPRQISEWLVSNGVDYLGVAYTDEGVSLREAGLSARIMVMNPDPSSFSTMIKHDLEPEIFSISVLQAFIEEVRKSGLTSYPVHIKLDTGMHRLGFQEDDCDELLSLIKDQSRIRVASVFSHLAASEDQEADGETHKQAELFLKLSQQLEEGLAYRPLRHILNSAGIIRFPEYQFDMVRAGIGLFGAEFQGLAGTKPVLAFKTRVSQVKRVKAGEGIGYGFNERSAEERDIAIIPVGYADGLDRRLSKGIGSMFVANRRVPVRGNVCMDMCMLDVTGLNISAGDEVEIFGENISISEIAQLCNTIPYEIMTSIPARVKRVYLYD